MNRVLIYGEIISSPIIYEISSINKPRVNLNVTIIFLLVLDMLIALAYFSDVFIFNKLFNSLNFYLIFLFEIIYISCVVFPILLLNNGRRMRLIFTQKGIALYPNSFLLKMPLSTLIAEKWEDIESYSFVKLSKILEIGSDPSKKSYLHICTKGLVPRCVNNYGISVFAITGHHLNENDIKAISNIFDQFKIKCI